MAPGDPPAAIVRGADTEGPGPKWNRECAFPFRA
jgi:hypothetical protein